MQYKNSTFHLRSHCALWVSVVKIQPMTSITRRDFLKLGGLSLLSTALLPFEPAATTYQEQPILYQGSEHYNRIALTYDDCYLVTMMHRLEEILEQHPEVRITLFPVGEALLNNQGKDPGVWKRFYEKGHEIGYHSFDHTNPEVVSPENVVADYDRWLDALREVLDEEPVVRFARPPFGNTSPIFLVHVRPTRTRADHVVYRLGRTNRKRSQLHRAENQAG